MNFVTLSRTLRNPEPSGITIIPAMQYCRTPSPSKIDFKLFSLNFFGARYYDADIGMWISPDPMRQFHDLYSYGGNPINSIDPDGNVVENINSEQAAEFAANASEADFQYYVDSYMDVEEVFQWENVYTGWQILQEARSNIGIDYSKLDCSAFCRLSISEATGTKMPPLYNSSNFHKYDNLMKTTGTSLWGDVLQWRGHVGIHDPVSSAYWTSKQGLPMVDQGYLNVNVGAHNVGYSSGYYPNSWWGTPKAILRSK